MKTTTCAMMFGCLLLMTGENSFAVDQTTHPELTNQNERVAELGAKRPDDQLRAWVGAIKPAAGHVASERHGSANYWEKAVIRDSQRRE